jgi:sulfide:quinone oxidoreductase
MHVVIAGGGVAALEAAIALRDLAGERIGITMLAPDDDFVFKPLSVGEPFALGHAKRVPLKKFARDLDVELVRDGLATVSPKSHLVRTTGGDELTYDKLIIATGARREEPYEYATTFRGQEDSEMLRGLVVDLEGQYAKRIAFVVPSGVTWSLPLYELALMTARRAHEMSADDVALTFVTPEEKPLAIFGAGPSGEVRELLEQAGIDVRCGVHAEIPRKGTVVLRPGADEVTCDRIVTLARLRGNSIPSLTHDDDGFLPIDNHGRVAGADDVYAAGDGTNFPIKQGGIACQQADAVAEVIAKSAGASIEPRSFKPVLRGRLITGGESRFMRTDLSGRKGDNAQTSPETLWWPPSKVAGHYLAPYLHETEAAAEREAHRRQELMNREYEVRPG